jgi:hypothetical protein
MDISDLTKNQQPSASLETEKTPTLTKKRENKTRRQNKGIVRTTTTVMCMFKDLSVM